jgi:diguanylate cyclase (GGDEF)-like protein
MSRVNATANIVESRHAEVRRVIEQLDVLPTTVNVPMRLLQLQCSRSANAQEIAEVLSTNPSLTSKVLGLANSSYFAPAQPVRRLTTAVSMIGLNNLLSLVFGLSLAGIFNKLGIPQVEMSRLWKTSLLKSTAAREFARKYSPEHVEEAGLCGLLQDIALPVMFAADQSVWTQLLPKLDLPSEFRHAAEKAMFGADHCRLGYLLAARLGLPQIYQLVIGTHHHPASVEKTVGHLGWARAVQFSAVLPHRPVESPQVCAQRLREWLPPCQNKFEQDKQLSDLLGVINDQYRTMLYQLGDADDTSVAFRQFLQAVTSEVARCMTSAIGESAAQITTLKTRESALSGQVRDLERQAIKSDYDSLTGVLNRKGFLSKAEKMLSLSRDYQTGCALGFADLDNFKSVNDTHGHAAGDEALTAVASALGRAVGQQGIVARLGGDEFVFLLLAPSENAAQETSRLIVHETAKLSIPADGGLLRLTASLGLFWIGVAGPAQDVASALADADRLMYQAKHAGKARCVFGRLAPPPTPAEPTRQVA